MVNKDYSNHGSVLAMIKEAQDANRDMRDAAREAKLFLKKRDGQWDPYAYQKMQGRYRGTFDMCNPIVDQIAGEIEGSDFVIKVSPSGGSASEDTAKTFNGLIRNIINISDGVDIFNNVGRANVECGFDAVEIVQEYVEGDSMDQDLIIKRIPNAIDSVWFDLDSTEQSAKDAKWAVKLKAITKESYKELYPEGACQSVGDDKRSNAYDNKAEVIIIGQLSYKKPEQIEIVQMTDGSVYEVNDDFESIADEMAMRGITIATDAQGNEKRRDKTCYKVYQRLFDGGDWLADEEPTVFDYVPIVPIYGNFDIIENKPIYFGKIEKLYDQQRSLNYAMSRDIEDGALSPSPTIWMTDKQAEGQDYSRMNIDRAPVRIYNADPEAPPINSQSYAGGPVASQGLQTTVANMQQMIASSSNSFNAGHGNAEATQSGIAGEQQIDQGNISNVKWFKALQTMQKQVGKILINAIPKVYDSTRQVRLLAEDGTSSTVVLNTVEFDQQTGQNIEINDLSKGEYDAVCDFGPAFNNQREKESERLIRMLAIDPTMIEISRDVLYKNQSGTGMQIIADRARKLGIQNGTVDPSEYTPEERQQIEIEQQLAAQQPPQEDPIMVAARAEEGKAQAAQMDAQNKAQQTQTDAQIKIAGIQLEQEKLGLEREKLQLDAAKFQRSGEAKYNTDLISADQNQQKIDLQAEKQSQDAVIQELKLQQQQLNDSFNNLKTMLDAMGAQAVISPESAKVYSEQVKEIDEQQDNAP